MMRTQLTCALLFLSAAAVQAQEPVTREPVEPATAADAQATPPAANTAPASPADAPTVDLKTRSATAAAIDAATVRAPADFDQPAQDITAPRNFWWLVGAIVLGGIILAVLL